MKKQEQSSLDFKLMSLAFKARDLVRSRLNVLTEAEIKPGARVLDYGCGPGSYIIPLAKLVGPTGRIYALDIHPLAIRSVEKLIAKKGLTNVATIHSDRATGLPDESVDVVLLYDVFHDLKHPDGVLKEVRRVLKADGIVSLSDHHMTDIEIVATLTGGGLFKLGAKGKLTHTFAKKP